MIGLVASAADVRDGFGLLHQGTEFVSRLLIAVPALIALAGVVIGIAVCVVGGRRARGHHVAGPPDGLVPGFDQADPDGKLSELSGFGLPEYEAVVADLDAVEQRWRRANIAPDPADPVGGRNYRHPDPDQRTNWFQARAHRSP